MGAVIDVEQIAAREKCSVRKVNMTISLAFLVPQDNIACRRLSNKVDVIVVYKVDRLTRSLADFAKLVELFDKHSVSFVSVIQQFNTTTSMGRLTLNATGSLAASKWSNGSHPSNGPLQPRALEVDETDRDNGEGQKAEGLMTDCCVVDPHRLQQSNVTGSRRALLRSPASSSKTHLQG
jgi:hypothetical protein